MRKPLFWNDKVKLKNGRISNLLEGDLHGTKTNIIDIESINVNEAWGTGLFVKYVTLKFDFSNKTVLAYDFYGTTGLSALYMLKINAGVGTLALVRGSSGVVGGKLVILYKED